MPKIDLKTIIRHRFESWRRNGRSTKGSTKQLDAIKKFVQGQINKAVLLCTRASSRERFKFTEYTINQGMKLPTVNLPFHCHLFFANVTYSSPLSLILRQSPSLYLDSKVTQHLFLIVPLSPSTSKQISDSDLESEGREASNHLLGIIKTP